MSATTSESIVWADEIRKEAHKLVKEITDRLIACDPLGFKNMGTGELRDVQERIVTGVVRTMLRLGTFMTTGGVESITLPIDQVVLKGGVAKMVLQRKEASDREILTLGRHSKGEATVCFTSNLAFEQARDQLLKIVTREQMDWLGDPNPDFEEPEQSAGSEDPENPEGEQGQDDPDWTGGDLNEAPDPIGEEEDEQRDVARKTVVSEELNATVN